MDRGSELGQEEEARLVIIHQLKQLATEHGLSDADRVQAESLKSQLTSILHGSPAENMLEQIPQILSAYREIYQQIDEERSEPDDSKIKIAIALETAAFLLDIGMAKEALDELYDARTMIDNEEPENIDQIEALYQQVKQLRLNS